MDYLFYSLGTAGDALPFVKLAAALNKTGAKSAFIGNEKFSLLANSMGVECFPVSSASSYEKTYNNPLTWSQHHAQNHYNEFHFPAIKPTFNVIKKLVQQGNRPFIVYQDALSGARMATEEFDLKSCQAVLAPHGIESSLSPAYPLRRQIEERLWSDILPQIREKAKKDTFERLVRPLINPARKELGLLEWTIHDLPHMKSSPAVLGLFPTWFKTNPGDWPAQMANTGFILGDIRSNNSDETLDNFIDQHGDPLVFTFGTGIPIANLLIDKIRHLCRLVGKPGIFVAHSKDTKLIENGAYPVLTMSSAPFSYLFSRSALVIHHGGIGTCAQALACGVRQIISPYTFDQPDNAFLLWRLGLSNSVDVLNDSVDQIASTVIDVLSSESVKAKVAEYQSITRDETKSSISFLLSLQEPRSPYVN